MYKNHNHSIVNPERTLWLAVLSQALSDAYRKNPLKKINHERNYILKKSKGFLEVCSMAGVNPDKVIDSFLKGHAKAYTDGRLKFSRAKRGR
jgi:hypothetical protein